MTDTMINLAVCLLTVATFALPFLICLALWEAWLDRNDPYK